jgi:SP family galactose:H+ symporter-like MFS transporter
MNPTLSFISVMFFIVSFAVSMGGVPYIMMSEIFPLKARAAGMAIASCANWAFNFMVSQSFDMLQSGLSEWGIPSFLYGTCTRR